MKNAAITDPDYIDFKLGAINNNNKIGINSSNFSLKNPVFSLKEVKEFDIDQLLLNSPLRTHNKRIDNRIELLEMFLPPEFINEYADKLSVRETRKRKLTTSEVVQFSVAKELLSTGLRTTMPAIMVGAFLKEPEIIKQLPDHTAYIYRRKKIGYHLLEELLKALPKPVISREANPSAWYKDFYIRIFDGYKRCVFASEKNWEYFGEASAKKSAYPQLLSVAAIDGGEHLPLDVKYAPVKKGSKGEKSLVTDILRELPSFDVPTLWIADRNFAGYKIFDEVKVKRGEDFLMRASKSWKFNDIVEELPDGSALFLAKDYRRKGKRKKEPMILRCVKYLATKIDPKTSKIVYEEYFLITSLLDHEKYPARELMELYIKRWEIEIAFDELLNGIFDGKEILSSKSPELVGFELLSMWLAYYVIRMIIIQSKELESTEKNNTKIESEKTQKLMKTKKNESQRKRP